MTLEQRVRRAERMLVIMATSGRRTRSEWRYKINSLIDGQMRFEATVREAHKNHEAEAREQKQRIDMLIQSQMETSEQIRSLQKETSEQIRSLAAGQAELSQSQKLTERSLRALIDTLRRGHNGNASS